MRFNLLINFFLLMSLFRSSHAQTRNEDLDHHHQNQPNNNNLETTLTQIFFGGIGLKQIKQKKEKEFESMIINYINTQILSSYDDDEVEVLCNIIKQGNIKKRNERPREVKQEKTSPPTNKNKSTDRRRRRRRKDIRRSNNKRRELLSSSDHQRQLKKKCGTKKVRSLTITYKITWGTSNNNINLLSLHKSFIDWMTTPEGKEDIISSMQTGKLKMCVISTRDPKIVDIASDMPTTTSSPTTSPTFVPSFIPSMSPTVVTQAPSISFMPTASVASITYSQSFTTTDSNKMDSEQIDNYETKVEEIAASDSTTDVSYKCTVLDQNVTTITSTAMKSTRIRLLNDQQYTLLITSDLTAISTTTNEEALAAIDNFPKVMDSKSDELVEYMANDNNVPVTNVDPVVIVTSNPSQSLQPTTTPSTNETSAPTFLESFGDLSSTETDAPTSAPTDNNDNPATKVPTFLESDGDSSSTETDTPTSAPTKNSDNLVTKVPTFLATVSSSFSSTEEAD